MILNWTVPISLKRCWELLTTLPQTMPCLGYACVQEGNTQALRQKGNFIIQAPSIFSLFQFYFLPYIFLNSVAIRTTFIPLLLLLSVLGIEPRSTWYTLCHCLLPQSYFNHLCSTYLPRISTSRKREVFSFFFLFLNCGP